MFGFKKKTEKHKALVYALTEFRERTHIPITVDGDFICSDTARIFHALLFEKLGVECVASHADGYLSSDHDRLHVDIYLADNDASEELLGGRIRLDICDKDNDVFCAVVTTFCDALREAGENTYEDTCFVYEEFKDKNRTKECYVSVCVQNFRRLQMKEAYFRAFSNIGAVIRAEFPGYSRIDCFPYSPVEFGGFDEHYLMFFTPSDMQKARESGDLGRMTDRAFDIVKREDIFGYFDRENFKSSIKIASRRDFTKETLCGMGLIEPYGL